MCVVTVDVAELVTVDVAVVEALDVTVEPAATTRSPTHVSS